MPAADSPRSWSDDEAEMSAELFEQEERNTGEKLSQSILEPAFMTVDSIPSKDSAPPFRPKDVHGGKSFDPSTELAVVEVLTGLSEAARLEAILYLKGRPMSLSELAALTGLDREAVEMALISLMADYAHRDTALEIFQDGHTYSLQLRQGLSDLVQALLPVDLSTAALRTLATIALKKRILQSDLVDLRGSGAYDHIKELLAQNFIERKRQSDGRSYWLTLSEKFHRTFALDQQAGSIPQTQRSEERDRAAGESIE
jgi:segregation and condensation protein B